MLKTPISTLQERLAKSGISPPVYTLISSKIVFQQTQFVIGVTCGKHMAKGTGTTKKEAKHNAAEAMIKLLTSLNLLQFSSLKLPTEQKNLGHNLQSSINLSDSSLCSLPTSSQDKFTNHVGSLMEFCVKNRIPDPCFDVVGVGGEAHNPVFTMSCTIGSECIKASAASKKVAKQNVAKEMLKHLESSTGWNITDIVEKSEVTVKFMDLKLDAPSLSNEKNLEIVNIYGKLTDNFICTKQITMKEYHIALANTYRNIFKSVKPDFISLYEIKEYCRKNVNDIKAIIQDSLNVSIKMINIKSQKYDQCIIGLKVTTFPSVVQIGISKTFEEAEKVALHKLLEYIILLKK